MRFSAFSMISFVLVVVLSGCEDQETPVEDAGADTGSDSVNTDALPSEDTDTSSVCDTDCMADRLLAMYQSSEPGCLCPAFPASATLDSFQIEDCAGETAELLAEWVSPRECMAQYFSDPEVGAELLSWIECRQERIRTRGPCIMALEAGDSCDQCPEFWDGGGDPCRSPDTDNNHFEICLDQMSGRPWE
jgi:hypothetical protein